MSISRDNATFAAYSGASENALANEAETASAGSAAESVSTSASGDSSTACNLDWLVAPFDPISLKQLNAKAAMLNRLDNKYVVSADVLREALTGLAARFDILEIEGKRQFTYETCYFDDPNSSSYFDHHRGRRQRFKVRVRKYTDAQQCFVEVKLKAKRGLTIKKRLEYEVSKYGTLDERAWDHIVSCYQDLYRREFHYTLIPVLEMRYKRVTLVAKEGGERMTIDCSLAFFGNGRTRNISEDLFVVETKSANGNGIADKILRALHQHPTKRCSKYCVARAALQGVSRYNKFLSALRKLDALPAKGSEDLATSVESAVAPAAVFIAAPANPSDTRSGGTPSEVGWPYSVAPRSSGT